MLRPVAKPFARSWFARSISHSAAGEDQMVLAWLETVYRMDVRAVRYCDVGANHPMQLSNTFLLYDIGASGVLIEPDPDLCRELERTRPRDTVINAGVAFDQRRSAKLQRLTSRVFNTFSTNQASNIVNDSKNWQPYQRQEVVDEIEIPLIPLNDILAQYFANGIDFMSIDTEGVELQILQSIDFGRFKPKLICVENSDNFSSILGPAGYDFVAQTPDNMIFRLTR
jgi:FkbM family methyltransferase